MNRLLLASMGIGLILSLTYYKTNISTLNKPLFAIKQEEASFTQPLLSYLNYPLAVLQTDQQGIVVITFHQTGMPTTAD